MCRPGRTPRNPPSEDNLAQVPSTIGVAANGLQPLLGMPHLKPSRSVGSGSWQPPGRTPRPRRHRAALLVTAPGRQARRLRGARPHRRWGKRSPARPASTTPRRTAAPPASCQTPTRLPRRWRRNQPRPERQWKRVVEGSKATSVARASPRSSRPVSSDTSASGSRPGRAVGLSSDSSPPGMQLAGPSARPVAKRGEAGAAPKPVPKELKAADPVAAARSPAPKASGSAPDSSRTLVSVSSATQSHAPSSKDPRPSPPAEPRRATAPPAPSPAPGVCRRSRDGIREKSRDKPSLVYLNSLLAPPVTNGTTAA